MKLTHKLVIAGALFGIIPIALGIVSLTTKPWINLNRVNVTVNSTIGTYGLFRCRNDLVLCNTIPGFRLTQGLLLAGVSAIAAGVIIAVLLEIIFKNRKIQLLPLFFLFAGPTLILIGLLLYAKYLFEHLSETPSPPVILALTYSIILMIAACIVGFLTAIYFAVVAGFGMHHHHGRNLNAPMVVSQYSERF